MPLDPEKDAATSVQPWEASGRCTEIELPKWTAKSKEVQGSRMKLPSRTSAGANGSCFPSGSFVSASVEENNVESICAFWEHTLK